MLYFTMLRNFFICIFDYFKRKKLLHQSWRNEYTPTKTLTLFHFLNMGCIVRFVIICAIWQTWKTPVEERYFLIRLFKLQIVNVFNIVQMVPHCAKHHMFKKFHHLKKIHDCLSTRIKTAELLGNVSLVGYSLVLGNFFHKQRLHVRNLENS